MSGVPDPAAGAASRSAAGIGMMLLGVLLFSLNDVLGKWLVATYSVGQVVLLRSVAALALLAPFLLRRRVPAAEATALPRPGLQGLRVALGTAEVACFYWAVGHMPLADAMTYWMAAPVYVVGLSALLLGERVGARRWAALLLGFSGVILALQPGGGLGLAQLVAVLGSMLYAGFILATRRLRGTPDVTLVTLQMGGALVLGLLMAPVGWVTPGVLETGLLLLLGVVATLGHLCVTRSLKLAPASVVIPWQYSFILWAVLFGWLVWGDVPGPAVATGGAVIVAAGLWLWRLDRQGG
jgi:drug/metabolite transporter (DMT)-like permease